MCLPFLFGWMYLIKSEAGGGGGVLAVVLVVVAVVCGGGICSCVW